MDSYFPYEQRMTTGLRGWGLATQLQELLPEAGRLTLPKTNIAPENGWLEFYFLTGEACFQVRAVSFREGNGQNVLFVVFRPKFPHDVMDFHGIFHQKVSNIMVKL